MTKSTKISLFFVLIFLTGLLLFFIYIHTYLDKSHSSGSYMEETEQVDFYYSSKR